jgi:hypothetical protein
MGRLSRRIRTARGSADEVVKAILADIDQHTHNQPQGDDMTILAMAIDTRRAKRKNTEIPDDSDDFRSSNPRLATEGGTEMDVHDDDGEDEAD